MTEQAFSAQTSRTATHTDSGETRLKHFNCQDISIKDALLLPLEIPFGPLRTFTFCRRIK